MNAGPRTRWRVTSGRHDPDTVARLLALLPDWFGIEESNIAYIESAHDLPTYLAWPASTSAADTRTGNAAHADAATGAGPVGVLLATRHFPESAEIHFMAVQPDLHRHGVGRALVAALMADLRADGCRYLQVKTLGPSHPDAGYARTRRCYTGMGFVPLEETTDLWGPDNPCLILVTALA